MLWVKAFHIISVICWFAVLFYLPRLFIYHAMAEDSISNERFKIMERKLYRAIGTPSIIGTVVFGAWTAGYAWDYYVSSAWFWIKIGLVIVLVVFHHMCGYYRKRFLNDLPVPSHTFFRYFNEVPAVLLCIIVILVVVKQPI